MINIFNRCVFNRAHGGRLLFSARALVVLVIVAILAASCASVPKKSAAAGNTNGQSSDSASSTDSTLQSGANWQNDNVSKDSSSAKDASSKDNDASKGGKDASSKNSDASKDENANTSEKPLTAEEMSALLDTMQKAREDAIAAGCNTSELSIPVSTAPGTGGSSSSGGNLLVKDEFSSLEGGYNALRDFANSSKKTGTSKKKGDASQGNLSSGNASGFKRSDFEKMTAAYNALAYYTKAAALKKIIDDNNFAGYDVDNYKKGSTLLKSVQDALSKNGILAGTAGSNANTANSITNMKGSATNASNLSSSGNTGANEASKRGNASKNSGNSVSSKQDSANNNIMTITGTVSTKVAQDAEISYNSFVAVLNKAYMARARDERAKALAQKKLADSLKSSVAAKTEYSTALEEFKLGDKVFAMNNGEGAIKHYKNVQEQFTSIYESVKQKREAVRALMSSSVKKVSDSNDYAKVADKEKPLKSKVEGIEDADAVLLSEDVYEEPDVDATYIPETIGGNNE